MPGPLERKYKIENLPDLTDLTKDEIIKLLSELPDVPGNALLQLYREDEYGRDQCFGGDFRFSYYDPETPEEYAERIKAEQEAAEVQKKRELANAVHRKTRLEEDLAANQKLIEKLSQNSL